MKKLAHYLQLRTLKYPTEDPDKVEKAIENALDLDTEELQEKLERQKVESQHGGEITRYSYRTKRWSQVKTLIRKIFNQLKAPEDLEKYLNDEGDFFLRLNKQEAYRGNLETTKSGDAIHIKVKIASYPFDQEQIKQNLKELIQEN